MSQFSALVEACLDVTFAAFGDAATLQRGGNPAVPVAVLAGTAAVSLDETGNVRSYPSTKTFSFRKGEYVVNGAAVTPAKGDVLRYGGRAYDYISHDEDSAGTLWQVTFGSEGA